ncbi:hypothetical protein F0310_05480 (plasmid) [Borrelia sp. A-FGy1]|uniref:hypothetical protein n=1 Tax=Borrelia sp. A-FGy1 TaxID=2608247 RepID=UPI0015F38458|nr:hypothetical protein [Borrelia sp. A-FGy1]QMU99862.1 hypothetical protein F0310_05480 [Borrelia sp. A-FGy1]
MLVSANTALLATIPTASSSTFSADLDKQENTDKLTKDDKEKLKSFFRKTKTYQSSLDFIYGTIDTYTDCSIYSIGCFSFSKIRSYVLADLENNKLDSRVR